MGYDQIPATLPVAPPGRGLTRVQQQRRRLVQALADAGLTEVLAYPFVSKAANDTFGVAEAGRGPDGGQAGQPDQRGTRLPADVGPAGPASR